MAISIEEAIKTGRAWFYRPGSSGENWEQQKSSEVASVGYKAIDLTKYYNEKGEYKDSKEISKTNGIDKEIDKLLERSGVEDQKWYKDGNSRDGKILETEIQLHFFAKIQRGDLIFAHDSKRFATKSVILGIGEVIGDYSFDEIGVPMITGSTHYHSYKVNWFDTKGITNDSLPKGSAAKAPGTIIPIKEVDMPWLTGKPPTPLREPKYWIYSVDPPNWDIVKRDSLWASKADLDKIKKMISHGDKVIFYLKDDKKNKIKGGFVGAFNFASDWYKIDTTKEGEWIQKKFQSRWPNSSQKFLSEIKLELLRLGNVSRDIVEKLEIFKPWLAKIPKSMGTDERKKRISSYKRLILQGSQGHPANSKTPIPESDFNMIFNKMKDDILTISKTPQPVNISRKQLAKDTFVSEKVIRDIEELLDDDDEPNQIIFHGPPGTSKTYFAMEFANYYTKDKSNVEVIQFHPSYNYEDFVEGIRPKIDGGNVTSFTVKPGILKLLSVECELNPNSNFVLIIDEINRGNISRILGELIYLLEYRDKEIRLTYSPKERFKLPSNLYIIGTMNTADRSIGMVDYALRRRFTWFEFLADPEILEKWLTSKKYGKETKSRAERVKKLMEEVNEIITASEMGKDCEIGQSYFMKEKIDKTKMDNIFKRKISPLLNEYYISDPDKIDEIKKLFDDFS